MTLETVTFYRISRFGTDVGAGVMSGLPFDSAIGKFHFLFILIPLFWTNGIPFTFKTFRRSECRSMSGIIWRSSSRVSLMELHLHLISHLLGKYLDRKGHTVNHDQFITESLKRSQKEWFVVIKSVIKVMNLKISQISSPKNAQTISSWRVFFRPLEPVKGNQRRSQKLV